MSIRAVRPVASTSTVPVHPAIHDDSIVNVQPTHGSFISLLMNEDQYFTFEVPSHAPMSRSTSSDTYSTMIGASSSGMSVPLVSTKEVLANNSLD